MSEENDNIRRLIGIMAKLRDPDSGCPWDVEQDFASIAPHTIEEAYEVVDAIDNNDMAALKDELGDLLLQVVFHAQMASEAGDFDFAAVVEGIADKMVRRHPHVFGNARIDNVEAQTVAWEEHKRLEREAKNNAVNPRGAENPDGNGSSALDGVISTLPALTRALKLQKRAARVGFDWDEPGPVIGKVREELAEVEAEIAAGGDAAKLRNEVGDLLFCCANLARKLGIDPETALRGGNSKFERRFRRMEALLNADGKRINDLSVDEVLEVYWTQVKGEE